MVSRICSADGIEGVTYLAMKYWTAKYKLIAEPVFVFITDG